MGLVSLHARWAQIAALGASLAGRRKGRLGEGRGRVPRQQAMGKGVKILAAFAASRLEDHAFPVCSFACWAGKRLYSTSFKVQLEPFEDERWTYLLTSCVRTSIYLKLDSLSF